MLKCECSYDNGIITGKYIKFYNNGNKHIECNYNNGLISGKYSEWYRNRQKLIETNYYRGKVDGDLYEWHSNGQLFKFCHYVKDLLNGEYQEYYENGSLYINCMFVNNKLLGKYLKYYNNSNMSGATVTTDFGTFNRSTGIFTTSVAGTYLLTASIHLKPDNTTSDNWSDAAGLFGLGFCPSANDTDIICGAYQTVNTLTKHIDITVQRVCYLNNNYGIILKALNWTDRAYNGSGYANPDGIGFTITKLH
jgi:hypothetical protein